MGIVERDWTQDSRLEGIPNRYFAVLEEMQIAYLTLFERLSAELSESRAGRDEAVRNAEVVCNSYAVENQQLHDRAIAAEAERDRYRLALRIIAGYEQCLDNLMSHADIARAALGEKADG